MSAHSYLVLGAGVFGISTALALIREDKTRHVTVVDKGSRHLQSASWDWSKVIRADYTDPFYARLALQAKQEWRTNPLYNEYYHETGLIWVDEAGFSNRAIENYSASAADEAGRMAPVSELRELNDGIFAGADFGPHKDVYLNSSSGWVEAGKALDALIETTDSIGVKFVKAEITLLTTTAGKCTGAQSVEGHCFQADKVILATGAETGALLARSFPKNPQMHANGRLSAAGLFTGMVRQSAEDAARLRTAPVFLHSHGPAKGAMIPPNRDGQLKITSDVSFTNTVEVSPGVSLSAPKDPESVDAGLLDEIKHRLGVVCREILGGSAKTMEFEGCRICWDAVTPTQDFLISSHPGCDDLWIASGGSFHAWKFFPILGKYVAQMLHGELDQDFAARWAWNPSNLCAANARMVPSCELSDIRGL